MGIAIAGNINLDIRTAPVAGTQAVLADGETGVEEIYESVGGAGANTAQAAAALGGVVHFFGCVGNDALGDRLEEALRDCIVTTHLVRKPTATGRSINLNWDSGCRHFISSLPNNRAMTADDIDVGAMVSAGCTLLLRSDVWFSDSMLAEGNQQVLERARASGIVTYLDINWDPEWSVPYNNARISERRAQLMRVLPLVHCVHGNRRELLYFTSCPDEITACKYLVEKGVGEVVVHRSAAGSACYNAAEGWMEQPAIALPDVTVTIGAGDVFCAAHMLSHGRPTAERLAVSAQATADHLSGTRVMLPRLDRREV